MCYLHRFSLAELLVDGTVFQPVKKKESYESSKVHTAHLILLCRAAPRYNKRKHY